MIIQIQNAPPFLKYQLVQIQKRIVNCAPCKVNKCRLDQFQNKIVNCSPCKVNKYQLVQTKNGIIVHLVRWRRLRTSPSPTRLPWNHQRTFGFGWPSGY